MLIVGIAFFAIGAITALVTMVQVRPLPTDDTVTHRHGHTLKRPSPEKVAKAEKAIRED